VGELPCECGFKMPAAEEGRLTLSCPACKRPVLSFISNRLQMLLREKIGEYYNNSFKCRCLKQYSLTPLSACCKIKYKPRSNIPFELHELVYLGKELVLATSRGSGEEAGRRLRVLEGKFDDFLEWSDYERVPGVKEILNL
jgi:hypothetical protein